LKNILMLSPTDSVGEGMFSVCPVCAFVRACVRSFVRPFVRYLMNASTSFDKTDRNIQ